MSEGIGEEATNTQRHQWGQLPWLSVAVPAAEAVASALQDNPVVRALTDVRADTPFPDWLLRMPASFLIPSPSFGRLPDTLISMTTTAGAFGVTQRREGLVTTLRLAVVGHFLGATAAHAAGASVLVALEYRDEPVVGSSAAVAALFSHYLTRGLCEKRSWPYGVALGATALGLTVGGIFFDSNKTDFAAHSVSFGYGVFAALWPKIRKWARH